MPKLSKDNIDKYRRGIDVNDLPLVFRDSIDMCRRIGFSYLWIDALCLVQDDPVERKREIEVMGDIYSSAACNFSALASADADVGLYIQLTVDKK